MPCAVLWDGRFTGCWPGGVWSWPASRRSDMRDLIFVSMEDWDDVWRRNQFVCAELARRYPQSKILFVGLAKDVSNRLRRGKFADLTARRTYTVPGYPNITR